MKIKVAPLLPFIFIVRAVICTLFNGIFSGFATLSNAGTYCLICAIRLSNACDCPPSRDFEFQIAN